MKRIIIFNIVMLISSVFFVGMANAQCSPAASGMDDDITCSSNGTDLNTGAGNDKVTVQNGVTMTGNVGGGTGNDTLINNGTIGDSTSDNFAGNDGDDVLINNGSLSDDQHGGTGNDSLENNGTIGDLQYGFGGDDTMTNSGIITRGQWGEGGNDNMSNSGTIGQSQTGGLGTNTLVNTGTINQDQSGGPGNDSIENSGEVKGDVLGGAGNDTVIISTSGTVDGSIDGGNNVDSLTFTGNAYQDEIDALNTAFGGCTNCSGTVILLDKSFTFANFEQLINLLTAIARQTNTPVDVAVSTNSGTITVSLSPTEIQCPNVKAFKTPDGFAQIYSGFDQGWVNGFLVAVFNVADAQASDVYSLDDPNTPAWAVEIQPANVLHVLDEDSVVVGICTY